MVYPGLRALVVDDNAYARAICLLCLRKLGIPHGEEAAGGAEAILRLMSRPYDLVMMDWYMPEISGAGVMQVMHDPRFGAASAMPVILMTAYPSEDNLERARAFGISEVLPKPFSVAQLAAALTRVLSVPEALDQVVLL